MVHQPVVLDWVPESWAIAVCLDRDMSFNITHLLLMGMHHITSQKRV